MLRCAPLPDGRHVKSDGIARATSGVGAAVLSPLPQWICKLTRGPRSNSHAACTMPLGFTLHPSGRGAHLRVGALLAHPIYFPYIDACERCIYIYIYIYNPYAFCIWIIGEIGRKMTTGEARDPHAFWVRRIGRFFSSRVLYVHSYTAFSLL
jgi:hypothetical protein